MKKTSTRNAIEAAIAFALLAGAGVALYAMTRAEAEKTEAQIRADSLAAEMVAARAELDGWEVRFSETEDSLASVLAREDSVTAALRDELEAARVSLRSLARSTASAVDTVIDTLVVGGDRGPWSGRIDDGILSARWSLRPPTAELPALFRMPYEVTIRQELVQGVAGDGRPMIFARALDDRVSLVVDDFIFEEPGPVEIQRCGFFRQAQVFGMGTGAGALLVLALDLFGVR